MKLTSNLLVVGMFWAVYHSWPALQGWPTERDLPDKFFLHAVNIAEPHSIYLWGTEFTQGLGQTEPRSYRLPYTPALHDKVDKATRKLRKGLPVIGQLTTVPTSNTEQTTLEQTQISDANIVFVDAPQNLIPGKN
ncbi:MAG: hypothetical protein AB8B63_23215 [Granulosicoccus sp.]